MNMPGRLLWLLLVGCASFAVAAAGALDDPMGAPACGNGVRDAVEQCDDGNTTNLDGCSATCGFEQAQRASWVKMQFGTDSFCTKNALGGAIGVAVRTQIQAGLDAGVSSGVLSIILVPLGATDPSGVNDPSFGLGILTGLPETFGGSLAYDGTSDLDWWHVIDSSALTAAREPIHLLPATIVARRLKAGPGTALFPPLVDGGPPTILASARLKISVGAASVPLASFGDPPGHLASENLDPALASYRSCGSRTAKRAGRLCGNVTARTLAATPIIATLTGPAGCAQRYTASHSMLDVLVGGCTVFLAQQIKPTQPDVSDPAAPIAGAGPRYRLIADISRKVTGCRDRRGRTVNFDTCLDSAAYSSFFKLATGRVIPR